MRSSHSHPSLEPRTFIDVLLEEERDLTAVARFSRWHDQHPAATPVSLQNPRAPAATPRYQRLLPLDDPRPGEQYAFEVDLDACTGCKACVTACHALNGLDDQEAWRRVGLLVAPTQPSPTSSTSSNARLSLAPVPPATQHLTTACHHCVDPACLNGCPVLAYHKDPITGIVRHLDDQCIGCTYCVMTCPYEVPQFSRRLGIVRKCDLCHDRVVVGEAPACAQACPNGAIRVTVADVGSLASNYRPVASNSSGGQLIDGQVPTHGFPSSCPPASITLPTTRYLTRRGDVATFPWRAANEAETQPGQPHLPLVVLLVLSQAAAGGSLFRAVLPSADLPHLTLVSLLLLVVGLVASALHLGQPLRAWRVFLGLRRSWLSREAVILGTFAALAAAVVAMPLATRQPVTSVWWTFTALIGVAGVGSSVMVYAATQRDLWRLLPTSLRFLGTTITLGAALTLAASPSLGGSRIALALTAAAAAALALTLGAELAVLRHRRDGAWTPLRRSACLLIGPLRRAWHGRWAASGLGLVCLALNVGLEGSSAAWAAVAGAVLLATGAFLERYLFFAAASPHRMPGGIPV